MSFIYPHYNFLTLFILGIAVGSLAPLIINEIKKTSLVELGFALCISYVTGTFLFNYDVSQRGFIAITLTLIVLISSRFLPQNFVSKTSIDSKHSLFLNFISGANILPFFIL